MTRKYDKDDTEINARVDEPFVIELEGNATTGYQWQLSFDEGIVKVVGEDYMHGGGGGGGVGAGGVQRFTLKPLAGGSTSIRALYKRGWEAGSIEEKEFTLRVRD